MEPRSDAAQAAGRTPIALVAATGNEGLAASLDFRAIAEAIPQHVWSARPDGVTDYYNTQFLRYLGRTLEDMQGWTWMSTLHPEDQAAAKRAWEAARRTGDEYSATFRILDGRAGQYRWHEALAKAQRNANGEVVRWFGTVTDVDERKRAEDLVEQSNRRFEALLADAPVGVAENDLDGRFLFVNRAFCALVGYSESELREKTWQEITHPEDLDPDATLARKVIAGELPYYTLEKRYIRKDGTPVWIHLFGNFVRDASGKPVRGIGVVIDITDRRKAEQALAASEEEYRTLVETQVEMIVRFGVDGTIHFANKAYAKAFGSTPEALQGTSFYALIPEKDHEKVRGLLAQLTRENPEIRTEHHANSAMGERWTLWTNRAVRFDAAGKAIEAQATGVDITERKRAEQLLAESEERFHTVADNIAPLAWTCDELGTATWYNKRWVDYTGLTLGDAWGTGWRTVHHPDHIDRVVAGIERARAEGRIWEDAFPLRRRDGQYRWFLSRAVPIRDQSGKIVQWFGTNTDIHELKLAEEALRDADRRKNEFIATLSHELRNPLAPLRGALSVLRMSAGRATNSSAAEGELKSVFEIMDRQMSHLVRLMDDLLEVSRISTGAIALRKEKVEISMLLRHAADGVRSLMDAAGHSVEIMMPAAQVWVDGDGVRLTQILTNLLNNAATYTDRNGRIVVKADASEGNVTVRVKDNGIGIPPDALDRIFDLFRRGSMSPARGYAGLGIGLTLARRLAELHGGTLKAFSEGLGKGSEFILTLPLSRTPPAKESSRSANFAERFEHRILVVDDNVDAAAITAMLLRNFGADVRVAHSAEAAFAEYKAHDPRIVFLDLRMPDTDGFELARRLKAEFPGRRAVLVALTGMGQPEDRRLAQEAGFDHHITKPAEFDALRDLISSIT